MISLVLPLQRKEFEELYREHWQSLYDFALAKTHDKDVAEEIVQEIFVTIWEKRRQWQVANPKGYLLTCVRNRVIDHYKEKVFSDLNTASETLAPDYPLFLDELECTLNEAMSQLPDKTREIFVRNRFEGQSAPEIAAQLHVPLRTVEYHITQALRRLRETFRHSVTILLVFLDSIF